MVEKEIVNMNRDRLLEKYKDYNPIVETVDELLFYQVNITISRDNKELEFMLEDNIITASYRKYFDVWDVRKDDFNDIVERLDKFMNGEICIISVFSKSYCELVKYSQKQKYKRKEIISLLKEEILNHTNYITKRDSYEILKEEGARVYVSFWDNEKDYEFNIKPKYLL